MRPQIARTSAITAGVRFACLLAVVLLLISLARLLADLGSTALDIQIVETALADPLWRTRLARNVALFALALLVLHLFFGLACWLLAVLSGYAFTKTRCSRRQWTLVWFLAGVTWLLVANAKYFPRSSLGEPYYEFSTTRVFATSLPSFLAACIAATVIVVLLKALRRHIREGRRAYLIAGTAALAILSWTVAKPPVRAASGTTRPNVIFLGIDSLRPDAVNSDTAPHVYEFMHGAVRMTDAITPLARTFPSWASVLTGRHPHTTGAYMNLLPRELVHTGTTLPERLRTHGYRTSYAIDETRFSNIDKTYGFDQTITPAMGGSDFVLTRFADTPLSNLVMNTRIGALLFPHVHANRAANVTYDPDSFIRRIGRELESAQPMFLAAHLTLPHWPYSWATSRADQINEDNAGELYRQAVRRADRQFGDLLALLERRGIFDNAIVVLLSDHGEAIGQPDDFMPEFFPDKDEKEIRFQRWGHGTSVFSPHQYRVVLGIRAYGLSSSAIQQPLVRHDPVSLLDLVPTILDLLGLPAREQLDGQSFAPLLRPGQSSAFDFFDRIRFTESEYNPQGFSLDRFSTSALAAAARVYRLDSATDRITVREDRLDSIMANRQYAALLGNRAMGVAIPAPQTKGEYEFIYIPTADARRTDNEPARLREALQRRFGIALAND